MYLSRVRIRLCENSLKHLEAIVKNEGYAAHQFLWELFPGNPQAKRDFLFRSEKKDGWPLYFLLSKQLPVSNSEIFKIETKIFDPNITVGQRLEFNLRANPVIAKHSEGMKNSKHHDVWMDAKLQAKEKKLTAKETDLFVKKRTAQWVINRSNRNGFVINENELQVETYQQNRIYKKGVQEVRYSTVDYHGILTVSDVDKFKNALFDGVGRAKAFGCGLLLVKPI
jgi:CRISPR system Cascade subunit CasE